MMTFDEYQALSETDREIAWRRFWYELPRIDAMEREPGDVTIEPHEAHRLAETGLQMFRMELNFDSILTDNGIVPSGLFAVVRGTSEAEVARMLRNWQGIVYERDRF